MNLQKLVADNQYVLDNLGEVVLPTSTTCYYKVPALNNTTMFNATYSESKEYVKMRDYVETLNDDNFLALCAEYAEIPSPVPAKSIRRCQWLIQKILFYIEKTKLIDIMFDASTCKTNIERVVRRNVVAFAQFNTRITEQILLNKINKM